MFEIKKVRLYPNGFVFTEKSTVDLPQHYQTKVLLDEYYYSFDSEVLASTFEKNNHFIIVHGHYIKVEMDGSINKDIQEELLDLYLHDYQEFLNALDFIGGRYAIIVGSKDKVQIYPDATHSRSVYYSNKSVTASSHIHLLASIENAIESEISNNIPLLKIHWHTTPYNDLSSLNPNFTVNLNTKERSRFFPRKNNNYHAWSHDEKLELFNTLWKNQMKYYHENYSNIVSSLSGGFDSRVLLAMSKPYHKNLKFFTYSTTEGESHVTKYATVLSDDQYIVRQILEDLKLNHQFFFIDEKKFKLTKEQLNIIESNTIVNHGKFLLNFYLHAFPEIDTFHIRGTLLEIGRAHFLSRDRKNTTDIILNSFLNQVKKYDEYLSSSEATEMTKKFIEDFDYNKHTHGYHLLDLYYWENRMGRWHPEVLNENDICFDTILPFNMRSMIEISTLVESPIEVVSTNPFSNQYF